MWNICNSQNETSIYILYDTLENPQYYICERLFTSKSANYNNFSVQPFNEIVSVDESLFFKRTIVDYNKACKIHISENKQILCVFCMLDEFGDINDPLIAETEVKGFSFCGFDLADNLEISAITNCGNYFEKVFTYKDLNEFGLIPNFQLAKKIQVKLMEEYPNEEHAYCALFAVWRRI